MNNTPLVSVVMLAYNHGKFIKEAIDSILMQEVDFEYEIIIGEDYSTDNTREIIFDYQNRFPNIIKPIIREANVGSTLNFYETLMKCQGKYIACLEGDDFWTDCNKLKKQVEFLIDNPKYILVAHRNTIVDSCGELISHSSKKVPTDKEIGKKELLAHTTNLIHPSTMCYRNIFKNTDNDYSIIYKSNKYGSHFMMLALLANKGPIYIMSSFMSAWRCIISDKGTNYTSMANKKPIEAAENYFIMLKNFKLYFKSDYNFSILNSKHYATSIIMLLKYSDGKFVTLARKFTSYLTLKEFIISIPYIFIKIIKIIHIKFIDFIKLKKKEINDNDIY